MVALEAEPLTSASWYRVASLKPSIRRHAYFDRHDYRGQIWYVLRDTSNERSYRFTPAANYFIGLLDGQRTLQQAWQFIEQKLGDDAPTQDEIIRLLGQLYSADILNCDVVPDVQEVFRRYQRHQQTKWKQRLSSPLAIRIPLLDPERFLTRTFSFVRPLYSWFGFILWLLIVLTAIVYASANWSELSENVIDRMLAPESLVVLWLVYPLVKLLHELGHAYAAKIWGGEIHEMGIMLLIFTPVPYVEASSSSAFRDKKQRMVVGASGVMVELFLASIALFVWLNVEPGWVSTFAYNVMLIGSISTLLFNGNPLLRFDGYYVLADAIEIPNLATRSKKYMGYLIQRYLFKAVQESSPATASGERFWFLFYGISSFIYRMFIVFFIVMFVAGKYFIIGMILAVWSLVTMVFYPMLKNLWFVFTSPILSRTRARAVTITSFSIIGLIAALFFLPAPLWTSAEGVVWLPEQAKIRAGTDGFVVSLLAEQQSLVKKGQALVRIEDPFLRTKVDLLAARVKELNTRFMQEEFGNRVRADIIRQAYNLAKADLDHAREQLTALVIASPADGQFIVPNANNLPARFVKRGDLIGYVLSAQELVVRVVVEQEQIGLVRERSHRVDVLLADWSAKPLRANVIRAIPGAIDRLPTPVLSTMGGGRIVVDSRDPDGLQTMQSVFQLDVIVPELQGVARIGNRVHVRFHHGSEPLALQWYRDFRQLFLRYSDV